jgi:hypothetical protein
MVVIFRSIRPLAFFAGLACGLVALALIGRLLPHADFARNFVRFHFFVGVEVNYFPTALQLRAILLRREPASDVIHVIVGGSSVFNGVGQHESRLWTRRLQDLLGQHYLVTNLATRAGSATDFGMVAMEILLREGRRAIYVVDGGPGAFDSSLTASPYTYMTYDAAARGLLLPWPARDRLLAGDVALAEPRLGARLNAWLNFNDLWGYIRYQHVSTVYHRLIGAPPSFRPLRTLTDPEQLPEQVAQFAYRSPVEEGIRIARHQGQLSESRYEQISRWIEDMLPPQVREHTLAVVLMNSPYYTDRLSDADRAALGRAVSTTVAAIQRTGIAAIEVGAPLDTPDYIDRVHLSVTGGEKLAPIVAQQIRGIAMRLGYGN